MEKSINILGVEYLEIISDSICSKPLLTVYCATYNHVDFIITAVESFINQNTNFEYKVVIIDDASTDGTTEIIKRYQEMYPNIIHLLIAKENTYRNPKRSEIYRAIKKQFFSTKYVAWCEGDDYWNEEKKLQIQVDYMESHSDCVMTMHNAWKEDMRTGQKELMQNSETERNLSLNELIREKEGIWPTASIVVRKEYFVMNGLFFDCPVGDRPLELYAAAHGKIHYFNMCMSVYRFMVRGSWSQRILGNFDSELPHSVKMIHFFDEYNKYMDYRYDEIIQLRKRIYYEFLIKSYHIDVDAYVDECNKLNESTNGKYNQILNKIVDCYRNHYDEFFISNDLLNFIKSQHHIYIMGAGRYGKKLAQKFIKNEIDFDGFVVSNNQLQQTSICCGKKVYKFSEIVEKSNDFGVVIGIDGQHWSDWDDLKALVIEQGADSYFNPFVVEPRY